MAKKRLNKLERNLMFSQERREALIKQQLNQIEAEIEQKEVDPAELDRAEDFQSLDPKLYKVLKKYGYHDLPPNSWEKTLKLIRADRESKVKQQELDDRDKVKSTQPIVNPIKDLSKLFILDGITISNFKIAGALLVIIAIISTTSYLVYDYQLGKNQNGSVTSVNQKTPIPKETSTPISIPTPQVMLTPDVAKNSSNQNNQENNQESQKVDKPEPTKNLKLEENNLALNTLPNNSSLIRKPRESTGSNNNLIGKELNGISIVVVSDSVELNIRRAIEKEVSESTKWRLSKQENDAEAIFKTVNNSLMLVNEEGKILWQDINYKENLSNPNYVKSIIKLLTK